jgi:glycine cleavage system transcriptional repressor
MNFVLTLTGPDRIGIVDEVTGLMLDLGGNVETSRMARLGGEFAVLMLVAMPAGGFAELGHRLERLIAHGYKVTTTRAGQPHAEAPAGWLAYRIEVRGADHEGIIHEVAHDLSRRGINIESMDSATTPAPISGVPLFAMTAHVAVPPGLSGPEWETGLEAISARMNLEIEVSALDGPPSGLGAAGGRPGGAER